MYKYARKISKNFYSTHLNEKRQKFNRTTSAAISNIIGNIASLTESESMAVAIIEHALSAVSRLR
jgi:ABC-type branched-subunit amino acid transport system ATPase component